ncbi:unnamed protein product [Sphagnum balticum]
MREKKSKWSFRGLCQRCVKWFFPSADSAAALPSTSQERDQPMHKPLHPIIDGPTIDVPSVSVDVETANAITSASGVGSHSFNVLSHTYDVFLNHRGPDVKTTFVAHLYEALCKAGFHPFLDVKSLVKGQHAFKSIDEALNGVHVHVAVFSKGYAESKYCLNELCDMQKSGKLILPIFLDVEPEHLRRPHHGPFATGFRKHMKKGRQDDIKRWEKALFEVANVTGFRLSEVNGDEAQLLRKVVRAIQSALPVGLLQQVVQHRIGLQGPVIEVVNYLHQVGVLGIVGMGGIGKTTLAKEVYNEYAKQQSFERQSFLHDVTKSSLLSLQQQLVHDLLGEDLISMEEFHNFFNRILRDQKALIVIDGIDDKWRFNQLIPSLDKLLMQGSQVIATSRDRNVLNYITSQSSTEESKLYEVQVLDCIHARQLFNWHAFYSDKASDGFQDLAKEVADSCNGLPLALEVIGAYLFDKKAPKHEVIWIESAKSLRVDPGAIDHKLQNMFDISYEGLSSPTDKLMFLDIACSMIGQHESPIMSIWESCIICTCPSSKSPHSSLMRLIDKSLVKLDENENFRMHEILRDMAKGVVKRQSLQEVGKRTHLWEPLETNEVLENDEGTSKIRSFSLVGSNLNTQLVAKKFAKMTKLHFLHLGGHHVEGNFSTWSKELRWLDWSFSPIVGLPPTLNVPNLVVLNLTGCMNLTCLWAEDPHVPCKSLEWLTLRDCTTLVMLPGNIGGLSKLKFLDLHACSTLKRLPDSIGQLQSLEVLYLSSCINLATLSDNFCNLLKLKKIFLDHCKSLKELPYGFGKLQSLVTFSAQGTSLFRLPDSISQLFNMETLNLDDCMDLQSLPPSISGLVKLRCLWMSNTGLEKLPEDFGQLQSLKELHLNHCKHLKTLPNGFRRPQQLEYLEMS